MVDIISVLEKAGVVKPIEGATDLEQFIRTDVAKII